MKKAIKKVTIYSFILALFLGIQHFGLERFVPKTNISTANLEINSANDQPNEQGEINDKNNIEPSGYYKTESDYAIITAPILPTNQNNIQNIGFGISNLENSSTTSDLSRSTDEAFTDAVASNYKTENNYNFNNSVSSGFESRGGPSVSMNENSSYSNSISNTELANNNDVNMQVIASRTTSNYNPSASRVAGANSNNNAINLNTGSNSIVLVESTPGSPGGGSDPYVPIDDYYGLFALLLCGGVIFWYRNKANKLVAVKA